MNAAIDYQPSTIDYQLSRQNKKYALSFVEKIPVRQGLSVWLSL